MASGDFSDSKTTQLAGNVGEFSVKSVHLDEPSNTETESYWYFSELGTYMGYYKTVPEMKSAIDSMVMWTVGRGVVADNLHHQSIIENITGWGEDSFLSIMRNHDTMTMINGDAFCEIIRNEKGTLINLKPLNPANIRTVVDSNGIIKRYDVINSSKEVMRKIPTNKMLHSTENRIGNEIHGVSRVESVKWIIDARNEAMRDLRRVMHRSTIRVLYVDENNSSRVNELRSKYKEGIKNGEVLILPVKKGEAEFEDLTIPPVQAYMEWIRYLERLFYKEVGVPEVILGGAQEYSESSSKVGMLTFEQPHETRRRNLEADLYNQVGIKVTFGVPPSLRDNLNRDEEKDSGQLGIQPNEINTGVNRSE